MDNDGDKKTADDAGHRATELSIGDGVGALIMDLGAQSFRIGYAQENGPKIDLPTAVGVLRDGTVDASALEPGAGNNSSSVHDNTKYFVDVTNMCVPRKDVDVVNCMNDGMVENWDLFEQLLDYSYAKCLHTESHYHPVLFSESPFNTPSKREHLVELMFEKYNVPAIFICKNAVLATFSTGRSSALVVDSGATHTSAIPVHDGYAITYAAVKSPLGGDFITMQCREFLQKNDIDVIPHYMVQSKQPVRAKEKAIWTQKRRLPQVNSSWHNYMSKLVIEDFQHTVLQVAERTFNEKALSTLPTSSYEFPEGYNQEFGVERYKIPETLFNPNTYMGSSLMGVRSVISTCVNICDEDIKPLLYNNIVVTGGNTLIQGYTERLEQELSASVPSGTKLKLIASSRSVERRFGAWIGGSITASSQTFHGIWLSKTDYLDRNSP